MFLSPHQRSRLRFSNFSDSSSHHHHRIQNSKQKHHPSSPSPSTKLKKQQQLAALSVKRTSKPKPTMIGSTFRSPLLHFLLSLFALLSFTSSSQPQPTTFTDVSLENPVNHFVPSPSVGYSCERVRVIGTSRLNLKSYANSLHVTLKPSDAMPERLHGKLKLCFHRNVSVGLCKCHDDEWKVLQKGKWSAVMSPYEVRYIDVKLEDQGLFHSLSVSVEEEFQSWRLFCLGLGFFLLLSAPVFSKWAPFYYSSSMALGVLLVVLLILFQGMKLLPMGKKNVIYLALYGSALGIGSYIAHYFSSIVNSILVSFGMSEEMHNPVSIFLLVGIILAGAALGYWIVRKFVLSEDGSIDAGIAQFVKWAMRVIGVVSILQSSLDSLLALAAFATCWCTCSLIASQKWRTPARLQNAHSRNTNFWQRKIKQGSGNNKHAEFLSPSAKEPSRPNVWGSSSRPYSQSNTQMKGHAFTSPNKKIGPPYSSPNKQLVRQQENFYSSFHKTPIRRFSKTQWEDFTRESTREALSEWASSPEVAKWIADNAQNMRINVDHSSDENMESSSGSSEETEVENNSGLNLFKWY